MTRPLATRQRLQRRQFLKLMTAGAAGAMIGLPLSACTHKKFYNPDEDIYLSGGSYADGSHTQHALVTINLTQQEKRVIDTPFLPHDILIDPNDKMRIICFEKDASNACVVDLQQQSVSQIFQSEINNNFSGHGTFSRDGKTLYSIESSSAVNPDEQLGSIVIRDAKTLHMIGHLPTLGLRPHDCQLLDEQTLSVSNTGLSTTGFHQPSLVTIDLKTEKLMKRLKLENSRLNCGHFETAGQSIVIASAPTDTGETALPGGVSLQTADTDVVTMNEPEAVIKRMQGEALGIAIHTQHQVAAITHPEANLLTFWSLQDKAIIKATGIENPRGITVSLDGNSFVISYGTRPAMAKISADTLEPQADSIVRPTLSTGEHLVNWSLQLRKIMPARIYG